MRCYMGEKFLGCHFYSIHHSFISCCVFRSWLCTAFKCKRLIRPSQYRTAGRLRDLAEIAPDHAMPVKGTLGNYLILSAASCKPAQDPHCYAGPSLLCRSSNKDRCVLQTFSEPEMESAGIAMSQNGISLRTPYPSIVPQIARAGIAYALLTHPKSWKTPEHASMPMYPTLCDIGRAFWTVFSRLNVTTMPVRWSITQEFRLTPFAAFIALI